MTKSIKKKKTEEWVLQLFILDVDSNYGSKITMLQRIRKKMKDWKLKHNG